MSNYDDHFLPERVDEQIDVLARTQAEDSTLSSSAHLVANLQQLHAEDSELIARVRVRLASHTDQQRANRAAHTATESRTRQQASVNRQKGPHIMELPKHKPTRKSVRFLEALVAALIVATLIGSMTLLLHSKRTSTGKAGDPTPTSVATPTPTPGRAISQNALYIATNNGIARLDPVTNKVAWHSGSSSTYRIVVEKNIVIFAGGDTFSSNYSNYYVEAVNANTGKKLWSIPYQGNILDLQGASGIVYVSANDTDKPSRIDALDINTGHTLWSHPSALGSIWELYQNDVVYGISYSDFFALNATTGVPLWQKNLQAYPNQLANMTPVVSSGAMYFSTCNTTKQTPNYGSCAFFAANATNGDILWHIPFGDQSTSNMVFPAVMDGVLYVTSIDGVIRALNPTSGATLWTAQTGGFIAHPILASQGMIYAEEQDITDPSTYLVALSVTSHTAVWSQKVGSTSGSINAPNMVIENGAIYLLNDNNAILAFQADSGTQAQGYHSGSIRAFFFVWQTVS